MFKESHLIFTTALVVFFLFISPNEIFSQDDDNSVELINGNQFRVSSTLGLTQFKSKYISGVPMKSPLLVQFSVDLEGLFYLKNGYFISPSLGLFHTTQKNNVMMNGMDWYRYRHGLTFLWYYKSDIGFGKTNVLQSGHLFRNQLKFGGLISHDYGLTRGRGGINRIETKNKFHPYLSIQSSIGFPLRNRDVLELGLFYRLSLSDIYNGEYRTVLSKSTFSNKGSEVGLNVGYTFTRSKRRQFMRSSPLEFKKYKRKFRNINSKSKLLETSTGLLYPLVNNKDPENIIGDIANNELGFRIEMEIGQKEKQFWEVGLHLGNYFSGYRINNYYGNNSHYETRVSDFFALAVNVGKGYRIVLPNKYNLFTISAGWTVNINLLPGGFTGSSSFGYYDQNYLLTYHTDIKNIYFGSIYANLNKDLQLTKRLYLSLNYRYNFGFMPTQIYRYTLENVDSGSSRKFDGVINGTSQSFDIGFKYVMQNDDPKENPIGISNETVLNNDLKRKQRSIKKRSSEKIRKNRFAISTGLFRPLNISNDPEKQFLSGAFGSAGFRLDFEFAGKNKWFYETGLHFAEYHDRIKTKDDRSTNIYFTNAFHGAALNIGAGYYLENSKGHHLLSTSFGAAANFVLVPQEYTEPTMFPAELDRYNTNWKYEAKTVSVISPTVYVKLNRDWKIIDRISLTTNYRYNYGWKNQFEKNVTVTDPNTGTDRSFDIDINGTSHAYEIGVKFEIK